MSLILRGLSGLMGVVAFACWVIVLIRLFQRGRIGPAVASLALTLIGIGPLVALIYGWIHADELGLRNVMLVWTLALLATILLACGGGLIPRQIGI